MTFSSSQEIWASFRMADGFVNMDDVHAAASEDLPVKKTARTRSAMKDVSNTNTVPHAATAEPVGPDQELAQFTLKHVLKCKPGKDGPPMLESDGLSDALGELLVKEHPELDIGEATRVCTGSDVAAVADAAISKIRLTDEDRRS